jgi:hypothetical protein
MRTKTEAQTQAAPQPRFAPSLTSESKAGQR